MSLDEYQKKRDFNKTPEPKAEEKINSSNRFVIQEHHATNLHYDFRLEDMDESGEIVVLKSWAVPKNIPEESGIKRLGIRTEDHPVDYIDFEGEIPEGEYGGGIVKIWDNGEWKLLKGSSGEGSMIINLNGNKIKGDYVMIKTKGYGTKAKSENNWLIWKK